MANVKHADQISFFKTKICVNCRIEKDVSAFGTRKRNHGGKRGRCKECEKIDREAYLSTGDNKKNARESSKKWYADNRDYALELTRKWQEKNKDTRSEYARNKLLKKYGITAKEYDEMMVSQNHRCKICGTDKPNKHNKSFFIDHCHKGGEIRGLLCGNCNLGIGNFKDDTALMSKAIEYIKNAGDI